MRLAYRRVPGEWEVELLKEAAAVLASNSVCSPELLHAVSFDDLVFAAPPTVGLKVVLKGLLEQAASDRKMVIGPQMASFIGGPPRVSHFLSFVRRRSR